MNDYRMRVVMWLLVVVYTTCTIKYSRLDERRKELVAASAFFTFGRTVHT